MRGAITSMRDTDMQEVVVLAKVVDPQERTGGMRLNAAMKQEVVKNAVEHGFGKKQKVLAAELLTIGTICYKMVFSDAAIRHAKALGEPWLKPLGKDDYGNKIDTVNICFSIKGEYHTLPVPSTLPIPSRLTDRKWTRIDDAAIRDRVHKYIEDHRDLTAEITKVTATLEAMLARITTYPSLEKNWAAGKKFYKHLPEKYPFRHQVPAVMIDELNSALGI